MTWPPPAPTSCTLSPPSVRRPGRAQVRRRGFLFLISRCMTQNIAFWRRARGKWPTPGGSGLFRGAEPLAAGGGILKKWSSSCTAVRSTSLQTDNWQKHACLCLFNNTSPATPATPATPHSAKHMHRHRHPTALQAWPTTTSSASPGAPSALPTATSSRRSATSGPSTRGAPPLGRTVTQSWPPRAEPVIAPLLNTTYTR